MYLKSYCKILQTKSTAVVYSANRLHYSLLSSELFNSKERATTYFPLLSSELFNSKERATTYFPMRSDPFSNKITIVHF